MCDVEEEVRGGRHRNSRSKITPKGVLDSLKISELSNTSLFGVTSCYSNTCYSNTWIYTTLSTPNTTFRTSVMYSSYRSQPLCLGRDDDRAITQGRSHVALITTGLKIHTADLLGRTPFRRDITHKSCNFQTARELQRPNERVRRDVRGA